MGGLTQISHKDLVHAQDTDPTIAPVKLSMCGGPLFSSYNPTAIWLHRETSKLVILDDLLYRKVDRSSGTQVLQLVLPKEHVPMVLKSLHDESGHLGVEKTVELLRDRFYWPKMGAEVEHYIKNCGRCLTRKALPQRAAPLNQIISQGPLDLVCIDFLSLEPDSQGHANILVVTDHFTRYAQAFPAKDQKATTVVKILCERYFVHYGLPACIHSDQGRDFESSLIQDLLKMLGIRKCCSAGTDHRTPHTDLLCPDWHFHIKDGCCSEAEGLQYMWCPPDRGVHLFHLNLLCVHLLPGWKLFTRDSDTPLLTSHRSSSVNGTREPDGVTFFILQGLSSLGDRQMIPFVILLLSYVIILGGNSMIIFVTLTDPKLHSPMYFFLYHLFFVDIVQTTSTIPKMLSGFLSDVSVISVPGCFLQMHFFIQLTITGHSILAVMAYDRYVAICHPLHYTFIMSHPTQLRLIAGAWAFSTICTVPLTIIAVCRPYCGPNVVRHGWCDMASVRRLVCVDTSVDNIVSFFFATVPLLIPGVLILTSYVLIGISISKMGVGQRLKAFMTCAAHLTVVSISFSSASFVYISYRVGNFSPEVRIIVAMLYAALTPFLNPVIYSLRNKELQESIRRTLVRFMFTTVSSMKNINTVS